MASEKIGLPASVSMAVGGMVGGGIFAVLGVVASAAGTLAWLAFIVAGVIALAAGYSFVRLGKLSKEDDDGPLTYIERFTGSTKLAGMTGWTFVVGYIGTMAMYAYAFGGYFTELVGIRTIAGLPARPFVSAAVIVLFVGLNVLGAHASGRTEDVLVGLKVTILLLFGLGGVYYGFKNGKLSSGLSQFGVGPVIAAALSFVAFEGWELLLFDRDSIRNPAETIRKAIYISIVGVTALYIVVAVVTTNLVPPQVIKQNAETALAVAARPFLGQAGFVLISIAALFSTGSAINATLFSSSRLLNKMVSQDYLPAQVGGNGDGEPVRALVILGTLTMAFTALGSLDGISSFASLAFITIFGAASYLAFRNRSGGDLKTSVVPAIGAAGAVATIAALLWHLYTSENSVFWTVATIAVVVVVIELLYFERKSIENGVSSVESELEDIV
ncbi:cationic amino acid transporter, putative [Haladaptatus paucihalophilus DX253]|uniref:Amino acid transporter n=1 Tax=Haladaptatus paucihalophilus DX253 TaxID=797209 RepID=E7QSN6_HALPU|nr:APC family permease [Haladaptatus paucihalophilus]EFW92445.1 cationic amino acid transporter, putative [Haladaptatus paucihalophilus DX253]SHK06371.1 Amino acid transporter [Haladaptatus paucihalophilus DX253]